MNDLLLRLWRAAGNEKPATCKTCGKWIENPITKVERLCGKCAVRDGAQ